MPDPVGFEASYKRHLVQEQRRAVLRAIAQDLEPDTTMGEILDAAEDLGWGDGIGALSLSQLAKVLVFPEAAEEAVPANAGQQPEAANQQGHTHAGARSRPRGSQSAALSELDLERMNLDRASSVFVPIVRDLGDATMQGLEERTGIGRRKLRFHIGQLVKSGELTRHGMGRGTYYTAS
jgi:hypothetical protein